MSKMLLDDRWIGKNGIGRYALEISSRIQFNKISVNHKVKKLTIKDLFYLTYKMRDKCIKGFYSYGINVPLPICVNKPIIVTIHDLILLNSKEETSFTKKIYFEKFIKPIIKRDNVRVITVSNFSKDEIVKWAQIDSNRVIVAYNGVSKCFKYNNEAKTEKYFLYVGNRSPHKNVEIIFKAFKKFKYYDEYNLVFSGEMDHNLRDYAQKYNICLSKIQTIGLDAADEVLAKYYQSATATILPSFEEGFGLPLVESMACGAPVLASKIEVLQEIALDAGLYFDPYCANELIKQMHQIVDDKKMYAEKVNKSLDRAKDFNWDKTASIVQDELKKLNLL
ncbi:glycosyltransferase family 4 protein [Francisella philomiragia]|uniref:glycosyltransferase family 4 protein n=1 Tax=Francisella philomiragia TaxID=28110 RepID=UPI000B598497|nr:glycosyltransferase family 1 protein [Francisella philomiragia]MBK2094782.1 glycosyltransferase family 4 protein [Francisella philomiragia]